MRGYLYQIFKLIVNIQLFKYYGSDIKLGVGESKIGYISLKNTLVCTYMYVCKCVYINLLDGIDSITNEQEMKNFFTNRINLVYTGAHLGPSNTIANRALFPFHGNVQLVQACKAAVFYKVIQRSNSLPRGYFIIPWDTALLL